MAGGTPTDAELIRLALEARLMDVHTAIPGQVTSYNAAKQVANVQPMVKRLVPSNSEDNPDQEEIFPEVQSVPVLWPRGNGYFVHLGLAKGDGVMLLVPERDPSEFRRTGENKPPGDRRLHHLAHSIALPGFFPAASVLSSVGSNMTMGKDGHLVVTFTPTQFQVGGASDAAALASKLDGILNILTTWTPVPNDGGAALKLAMTTWLGLHPGTTGSANLKVGG